MSAKAFAKSHQPAGRASGTCRNFRPHIAPTICPTSGAPGKPLALRLPATHQATAPVSPGRQKSEQRGPAPRPRLGIISLRYIMGKSPVSRPNTHRATDDMPAIADIKTRPPHKTTGKNVENPPNQSN